MVYYAKSQHTKHTTRHTTTTHTTTHGLKQSSRRTKPSIMKYDLVVLCFLTLLGAALHNTIPPKTVFEYVAQH